MLPSFLCLLARHRGYHPVEATCLTSRVPIHAQYIDTAIKYLNRGTHNHVKFKLCLRYLNRAVVIAPKRVLRALEADAEFVNRMCHWLPEMCLYGCTDLLQRMHWTPSDYDNANCNAYSALKLMCKNGNTPIAKLLTDKFTLTEDHGRNNNSREDQGRYNADTLMETCINGHLDTAKWFAANFYISDRIMRINRKYAIDKTISKGFLATAHWLMHKCQLSDDEREAYEKQICNGSLHIRIPRKFSCDVGCKGCNEMHITAIGFLVAFSFVIYLFVALLFGRSYGGDIDATDGSGSYSGYSGDSAN